MSTYKVPQPRQSLLGYRRDDLRYSLFIGEVVRVDYEKGVADIKDIGSSTIHESVTVLPANFSSFTSTDLTMPEEGAKCLCCNISPESDSNRTIAVVSWVASDALTGKYAIARRLNENVPVKAKRKRGVFRKAYPGQKVMVNSMGYTAKIDGGWDQLGADFSRDVLDPFRREWTQITSRRVEYTDSGITFRGIVYRPDAEHLKKHMMPDGTTAQAVLLQEDKDLKDRYLSGVADMLPVSEVLERIQEFALDFPVPKEVLETEYLDDMLGLKRPHWERTSPVTGGQGVGHDDQSFLIDQTWDHPDNKDATPVGPTKGEGPTPRRRGWILERSQGTLVGYNRFDKSTYGKILKTTLFPANKQGRFGTDTATGHMEVKKSKDHVESRLAASAYAVRFPHDYNTTRWDITKEGLILLEVGCTIPKENIPWDGSTYEHPYGAGRSLEAHFVGSTRIAMGKNRDEEESLDLTTLGQVVLRLGCDDTTLPDADRDVQAQNREKADAVSKRELQFWKKGKLTNIGDAGDLTDKAAAERVSLRGGFDGGTILRLGARSNKSKRRHLKNGYSDGQGKTEGGNTSRAKGRPTYGSGDAPYRFHDLTQAGSPKTNEPPYTFSGAPISNMDCTGLSLDLHAVSDILLRIGQNKDTGQSLMLDLGGGMVAWIGKDKKGRSITASLDGGAEITIGSNDNKKGLQLEINGDVDISVVGNFSLHATGDITLDANGDITSMAKFFNMTKGQNVTSSAQVANVQEGAQIIHNEGAYSA